jgi:ribonuclease HII
LANSQPNSIQPKSETAISMDKRLFIGVDEAGYGPNLGPLLICGSAMLAPKHMLESELCACFSKVFKAESWKPACCHVPLGDSKKLYQPGSGLDTLEIGLLSCLQLLHADSLVKLEDLQGLLDATHLVPPEIVSRPLPNLPWYQTLDRFPVPRNTELSDEISRLSRLAGVALAEHDIELIELSCVVVAEPQFNAAIDISGSKGQLLSQATLGLVAHWIEKHRELPVEVFCDRQGGRKNYMPVLLDAMPEQWFTETLSSPSRCSYRRQVDPPCDIHFSVGGDQFPPTALASMLAKYLRERLMEAVNAFWLQQVPGLKPTAGYPQDAKRYRAAIEGVAQQLKLAPAEWWRNK